MSGPRACGLVLVSSLPLAWAGGPVPAACHRPAVCSMTMRGPSWPGDCSATPQFAASHDHVTAWAPRSYGALIVVLLPLGGGRTNPPTQPDRPPASSSNGPPTCDQP